MQTLDRFYAFFGGDAGAACVHIDEHLDEECLVEDLAGPFAGEPVNFAGVVEQVEEDLDGFAAGVDLWVVGVGELALEVLTLVADLAEPLADLVFGSFWVADEVEVAVFLPIQLCDLGLKLVA